MTHDEMHAWFDYLLDRKVIDYVAWLNLRTLLDSRRAAVHTKVMEFAHRMKESHPDLWVSFRAKQRVLGLSSSE